MEKPLVSTITASFRTKKYLRLFLEELPKQTFFHHLEVVLDHNQPDDEEIALVRDFQMRYPGRLKHHVVDPVVPLGTSWNNCLESASADLVTIWSVDDLRTPTSIELQARNCSNDPTVDLVYGGWAEVSSFVAPRGRGLTVPAFHLPISLGE